MKQDRQESEEVQDSRDPEEKQVVSGHPDQQDSRVLQDLTQVQAPAAKLV